MLLHLLDGLAGVVHKCARQVAAVFGLHIGQWPGAGRAPILMQGGSAFRHLDQQHLFLQGFGHEVTKPVFRLDV